MSRLKSARFGAFLMVLFADTAAEAQWEQAESRKRTERLTRSVSREGPGGETAQHAPLTLQSVIASARAAFPLIAAAKEDVRAAQADLRAAEGGFDTTVRARGAWRPLGNYQFERLDTMVEQPTALWGTTLVAGWRWGTGNYPSYYGEYETNRGGELRAGAVVPFLQGGSTDRRRASLTKAELGREAASLSFRQRELEVVREASKRYWMWVAAGKRARVAKELLDIAERRDIAIERRVSTGDLPSVERVDNQRAVMERRLRLLEATRRFRQAGIELGLYLRDASGRPIQPREYQLPDFPEPAPLQVGFDQARQVATQRRPELRRYRRLHDQSRVELKVAENQALPRLDVGAFVSRDLGEGSATRRPTELEVSLFFELPLQRRTPLGRVDGARALVRKIRSEQNYLRDRVDADVRDALLSIRTAYERVKVARDTVRIARELEEAERVGFGLGHSTMLVVNLREQATADAAQLEVDALADYFVASADLSFATGGMPLNSKR